MERTTISPPTIHGFPQAFNDFEVSFLCLNTPESKLERTIISRARTATTPTLSEATANRIRDCLVMGGGSEMRLELAVGWRRLEWSLSGIKCLRPNVIHMM
uniref:Uncharacterized protein n=1 Tax=Cacopsylla melanoneura TaxID=428564 RepID=A0A8D9FAM8_9HEMI